MKKQIKKVKKNFYFLLLIFLSYITDTALAQETDSNNSSIQNFEIEINSLLTNFSIPGAAIAIVSKDSIDWIGCFGVANFETNEPITENTLFRVASISKSFVGLGFLKLSAESRIDLNTRVKEIIPEIEIDNSYYKTDPVRIVHLLEHTAGFDAAHFYEYYNLNDDPQFPLRKVLSLNPNSRIIRWKPGTRIAYTNHGYTVAGYILEKITGEEFEDYLKINILDPIGMTSSTFKISEKNQSLLAQGYTEDSQPFPNKPFYLRPASSLKSSVKEMAKFVHFMLNRGKIKNKAIIGEKLINRFEVTETTTVSKKGFKAGYGLGVKTYYRDGYKCFAFTGGIPGFTSIYAYIKDLGLGCVILVNSSNVDGFFKLYDLVFKYLVKDSKPTIKPVIKLTPSQIEKFLGYYELRNPDEQLSAILYVLLSGTTIFCERDTLYMQDFMSEKKALIPVSANTFRRLNEPEASIIFS
jgi:CubicO group peptidase (beta-lactamase class C family)